MTLQQSGPSRRTLVKGAAWSVPVVAVGSAAPAMASSPDPGLNGWVLISRFYSGWPRSRCHIRYDGYNGGASHGGGVRLGFWVWDATAAEITEPPSLTIHLPYEVTWSFAAGSSGWSLPNYVGTSGGFHLYRTTYSGTYTDTINSDGYPEVVLDGRPHFTGATGRWSCPTDRSQKLTRRVGIDGEIIEFTREVSFPQAVNTQNSPMAIETAPEEQISDEAASTAGPGTEPAAPEPAEPAPPTEEGGEIPEAPPVPA